ncbi:hypothetical protein F511_01241 [Dorcoceras hygrometricum]|uniref:Carboxypeptidase n=1 Tax=Dorcoceras hygrometricum TaxID=472368 RepID=A0A2Z7BS04_9LAMI|nr:hypothetical protein F511_01241 [Dorcoceras hygrometricum]
MAYGASEETGPFRVPRHDGLSLCLNNLLFLESQAGVGFSSRCPSYKFPGGLNGFHGSSVDHFYISGESYAGGHYIPQLSKAIVESDKGAKNLSSTLKVSSLMLVAINQSTCFM